MNAGQLCSYGFDEHCSHNGRIHTAGQGQQHFPVSNLLPDQLHLVLNEVLHIPICLRTAVFKQKFL